MRLPGTSPASPDDVGDAHPGLAAALASGDSTAIASCLLACRLLVPVVAMPGEGDADMAVPALVAPDGRRALPVFSSYDALRAWQPDARPVPMPGLRVMAGAGADLFNRTCFNYPTLGDLYKYATYAAIPILYDM